MRDYKIKPSGNSKYAKKFKKRVSLANQIGSEAFYHNEDSKRLPLAMPILKGMVVTETI